VVMDELRPKWVELSQVQEGSEPFVFRTKFLDWFSINAQVTAKSMMASKQENLKNTGELHAITAQQVCLFLLFSFFPSTNHDIECVCVLAFKGMKPSSQCYFFFFFSNT
jgi:hypothetical protein